MPRIHPSFLAPGHRISGVTGAVLLAGIVAGLSCKDSFPTAPTEVAQVMLAPRGPSLVVGDSVRLIAAALDENFTGIDGKTATWKSGTGTVATVDARGIVRGLAEGTSVITATIDGFTDTTLVTVMPVPVDSIDVSPNALTVTAGLTGQLTATTYDDEGNVLTGRAVSWTSGNGGIASVSEATGLVTGVTPGVTWIHATSNGRSDSAQVTVIPVPVRQVVVSPKPAQVQQGATLQLSASTRDSIGGIINGRTVTWASRNAGIVSVNAGSGVVTGVSSGSAYVVATSEGVSDSTLVTVAAPTIVVSSDNAVFVARWQQANPASQVINVTGTGPFALSGLSVSISYGATGGGWLAATLGNTAAPTTLTLQPVTGVLAPNTYTATVTISSSQPGVQSKAVHVTFTVQPQPAIGFSNDAPQFAAQANGVLPAAQHVTVTNAGTGTLAGLSAAVSYAPGASGWLNAALGGATAPATLTLQPNTTALGVGTYTAFVVISSTDATVRPDTVTVSYVVAQGPIIGLSRTSVPMTAQAFAVVPDTELVTINNAGQGTLSGLSTSIAYNSAQTGWLSASLSATTAPSTLTLVANASGLPAGTYSATVTISSSVVGVGSQQVTVTFTVTGQPVITLTPDARSFTATRGGTLPSSQAVTIGNSGGGSLTGLTRTIEYLSGAGWLTASLNSTTAPATLTLQPNTTALVAGGYSARVIIASTVPGVAPDTVSVSYTVQQAQVALSQTSVALGSVTRGASIGNVVINVTNGGQGTLDGLTVFDTVGFVTATLGSAQAPTTLTLGFNTTNLAAGSYTRKIAVLSSLPGVTADDTVTVTVTVLQPQIAFIADVARSARPDTGNASQTPQPANSTVTVTNGGTGTLTLSAISVSDNASWLTTSYNSTTGVITLGYNKLNLAAGVHSATVTVSSSQPGVNDRTFTVNLTLDWSFASDIAPMFSTRAPNDWSCAGCHTNSNGTGADFTNWSHLTTLNFSNSGGTCQNRTRVVAGNATSSLIYQKLANTHTCGGNRMPDGGPAWSSNQLRMLREWINRGASNN